MEGVIMKESICKDNIPKSNTDHHVHRRILITGASRGIGAALAQGLWEDGHTVIAAARSLTGLRNLPNDSRLIKVELDVTSQTSIDDLFLELTAHPLLTNDRPPVEVLINNAGVADSAPLHRTSDELWMRMMDVNLTGSFRLTRAVVPALRKATYGRIIFMASVAGLAGNRYTSAYCASKHGVIGMMRALALELAQTQVTTNAICPGFVETDMAQLAIDAITQKTQRTPEEARAELEALNPQHRLIQTDELLHISRFLISEGARGVNGQALPVDGGQVQR